MVVVVRGWRVEGRHADASDRVSAVAAAAQRGRAGRQRGSVHQARLWRLQHHSEPHPRLLAVDNRRAPPLTPPLPGLVYLISQALV